MIIKSIQKVIKVGSSAGVTLPAKDMKRKGVKVGDQIVISFEPIVGSEKDRVEIVALTQKLIARHKKALKNLSQR